MCPADNKLKENFEVHKLNRNPEGMLFSEIDL
jgi:hypothetical protein